MMSPCRQLVHNSSLENKDSHTPFIEIYCTIWRGQNFQMFYMFEVLQIFKPQKWGLFPKQKLRCCAAASDPFTS